MEVNRHVVLELPYQGAGIWIFIGIFSIFAISRVLLRARRRHLEAYIVELELSCPPDFLSILKGRLPMIGPPSLEQKLLPKRLCGMLVRVLFLLSPDSVHCAPETAAVDWPLNDNGSKWTQLEIPIGFSNIGTKTMRSTPRKETILEMEKQTGTAAQVLKLWASWPSMGIPTAKTPAEFYLGAGSGTMWLSLQSGQSQLQFLARIDLALAGNICKRPDSAKSHSDLSCREGYLLVQKPPEFELKHRGVENANDATIYRAGFFNDIYYTPDLGDGLITFIRCSDEENHPLEHEPNPTNANCEQIFVVPSLNATARVSYSRDHLKDWQSIQQAWIKKLQSFVVQ